MSVLLAVVLAASWGLRVEREPAAQACPDEAGVRRLIAERLGSDPFTPSATQQLVVHFSRDDSGHHALVTLFNASGIETGRRALASRATDCAELAGAVALSAAIVIDPLVLTRPTPDAGVPAPPEPTVTPPPMPPADEPRPVVTGPTTLPLPAQLGNRRLDEVPEEPQVNALWLGVGAGLSLAQVPSPAGVGEVLVSWESKDAQLSARFGLTTPGQIARGSGSVSALLIDGGLNGCLRWSRFGLCLVARVGTWQAWASGFPGLTGTQSAVNVSAGLAPFLDIPVGESARLRLHATVFAQFARVVTSVGGFEVWSSPPVGFSLTASALFRAWGAAQP